MTVDPIRAGTQAGVASRPSGVAQQPSGVAAAARGRAPSQAPPAGPPGDDLTTSQRAAPPAAPPEAPSPPAPAPATPALSTPTSPAAAASPPESLAPAEPAMVAGLPQLMRILGVIVAPTTLLTSLLLYFGWQYAVYFFDYFGVHSTVLGLTTQDYVIRSRDALFIPVTVIACVGLVALWGHAMVRARLAAGSRLRVLRTLMPVIAIVGLVLAVGGIWSMFSWTILNEHLAVAPLSLAVGVPLLAYAVHLWRVLPAGPARAGRATAPPPWVAVAEWAGVFLLVGLSLFWAANEYSAAVGRSRARQFVAELRGYPSVAVYSERSLRLNAPGVREVRCQDAEAAYRFRYDGLKLVMQSGNQYLFLPEGWSPGNGVAILVPRSDSLRLEFRRASAADAARASGC